MDQRCRRVGAVRGQAKEGGATVESRSQRPASVAAGGSQEREADHRWALGVCVCSNLSVDENLKGTLLLALNKTFKFLQFYFRFLVMDRCSVFLCVVASSPPHYIVILLLFPQASSPLAPPSGSTSTLCWRTPSCTAQTAGDGTTTGRPTPRTTR